MPLLVWSVVFFFKQKTAYEMRISDWSSDVCSSDLIAGAHAAGSPLLHRRPVVLAQRLHERELAGALQPLAAVDDHNLAVHVGRAVGQQEGGEVGQLDRKSTRLNSSH